jgi:microsomal dipeptidase-like Zn-dependent dipeptidase
VQVGQQLIDAPVFDLHCDAVLKLVHRNAHFSFDNLVSHVDIPKMRAGNVNGLIYSIWADPVFTNDRAVHRTQYMLNVANAEIASSDGVLPHIDYVIELIGEDHIGIGTDFDGMPFGPVGLEDCLQFDNLRTAMSKHGYTAERIKKILGENVRRVMKEILPRL